MNEVRLESDVPVVVLERARYLSFPLNAGQRIVAGRMIASALFYIEHNLAPSALPSLWELVSGI